MLLSAFSFSVMAVCVKQLEGRIPVAEVVFARSVVSLGISWWLIQRMGLNPWGKKRRILVLRGIVGTLALFCVYAALAELPLAAATVFQYLYPTFTTALAWGILGEITGKRIFAAMALGWLGVFMVAQPFAASPLPALPTAIAITGALLTSIAYVTVRSLAEYENPMVIVFYFPLVSLPMSLPLLVLNPVLPSGSDWAWLIGVGIFTQLGQIWLTQGLTQMPAARATAISYAQVVFASTWGVLFFGEILNISTIIGAALVLGATILSLKMK
ncbi:DMT family transporter [Synechococcus sp. UW140]|uniref:DMT family transporter n=1 Tax=Synechococcus sp. UW140 TaxID=368503 RepID=UPI0025F5C613|nr:DMT family transporter [Synechococcus sp. UW140]